VSGEQGVTTMRCRDRSWRPDAVQGLERRGIFEPGHESRQILRNRPSFVALCGETRGLPHCVEVALPGKLSSELAQLSLASQPHDSLKSEAHRFLLGCSACDGLGFG
jgi:hypothetical protein